MRRWRLRGRFTQGVITTVCFAVAGCNSHDAGAPAVQAVKSSDRAAIVGTWLVKHSNAPFPMHMYVFNGDGTLQQANPDAGDPHTSDSDGKGVWITSGSGFKGKWVELTADRLTHKYAGRGEISFEVQVRADHLSGTGSAVFYDADGKQVMGPSATTFDGNRITVE